MKYPWAVPGAKVAVVGKIGGGYGDEIIPQVGGIYTIREVVDDAVGLGIRLVEIVNPERAYRSGSGSVRGEPNFSILCFKPVLPDTTHIIEQLKASLPKRGRVDA